jgi:protein-tyrosine phosphatase
MGLGFVDLHCHVLPGLDDGVKTLPDALGLIARLAELGFDTLYATPHQRADLFLPTREAIDAAHAEVRAALPAGSPALHLGAENFWDEVLAERLPRGAQPAYTGERAFLFEIPVATWPVRLLETLFDVRVRGLLPVVAHPERYSALWNAPDRIEAIGRTAALVIDLGALDGAHGVNEQRQARMLVDEGLAHAAASDAHSLKDAAQAAAGLAWIKKRHGEARVQRLLADGPRAIVAGEIPE